MALSVQTQEAPERKTQENRKNTKGRCSQKEEKTNKTRSRKRPQEWEESIDWKKEEEQNLMTREARRK